MIFKEAAEALEPGHHPTLQVFATDLDQRALDRAREGIYPSTIANEVSPERLSRFFVQVDGGYQVVKSLRDMVVFASQNLLMEPPFTRLSVVSCRNLLIYLTPEAQAKVLPLFHYTLNPGGVLFLGSAETVGGFSNLFAPLDLKSRIFRRLESAHLTPVEFPATFAAAPGDALISVSRGPANIQSLADGVLLRGYAPAAVLTNDRGDVLYVSGRTGKYLELASGRANWNVIAMARQGLRSQLSAAFQKAVRQEETITLNGLVVETDGGTQTVDVTLQPLSEPSGLRGTVMVVFRDTVAEPAQEATGRPVRAASHGRLAEELAAARLETHTVREEMQASQEELKSANEELQSTNEELQATNEELTTSKEEMQSMNEELQTINHELQVKADELVRINDDIRNLLDSTHIATLFLDSELRIRRFTREMTTISSLIGSDVGRPVTDIASDVLYEGLSEDSGEVLRTLVIAEKRVPTHGGRWFKVRIQPYRTQDNMIDGVVITFADISDSKALEADLRSTQAGLEDRVAREAGEPEDCHPVVRGPDGKSARGIKPAKT